MCGGTCLYCEFPYHRGSLWLRNRARSGEPKKDWLSPSAELRQTVSGWFSVFRIVFILKDRAISRSFLVVICRALLPFVLHK